MPIRKLHISNYKSIRNITIDEPNPFTVFVGPNGSGKSNIFEAIEFLANQENYSQLELLRKYKGEETIGNRTWLNKSEIINPLLNSNILPGNYDTLKSHLLSVKIDLGMPYSPSVSIYKSGIGNNNQYQFGWSVSLLGLKTYLNDINHNFNEQVKSLYNKAVIDILQSPQYNQFVNTFSRLFIGKTQIEINKYEDDTRLSTAAGNVEEVLSRILQDDNKEEEILEWLRLLIPGFETIEITKRDLSGRIEMLVHEKGVTSPFPKSLISDGTYNIIALLTALFQSDKPQFICIEEPENGLNPKVVRELVNLCRAQCIEKGHYIWLNTHSQTLVRELTPKEIIIVDKINAETQIKQIPDMNLHGVKMDEALLSNMIGGGIPW